MTAITIVTLAAAWALMSAGAVGILIVGVAEWAERVEARDEHRDH